MTSLSVNVDANIGDSVDLFGKTVSDLQENIVISSEGVTGTVKYIDDYSSAYGSGEDSGNYLVIHCSTPGIEGATITVEVVGGLHGPQTLDEDGICICRITDKSTQTIRVVASKEGYDSDTVELDLSELTLEAAASEEEH